MMLVHLDDSRLMHGACWFRLLVQVVWCRFIGTGCYSDRLKMEVVYSVIVIDCIHFEFIFQVG